MKKVLKLAFVALSSLLLSACSLFQIKGNVFTNSDEQKTDLDWTKNGEYFDNNSSAKYRITEKSPLLTMENNNKNSSAVFYRVEFQGYCEMVTYSGVTKKFEELWDTEVKEAIKEILVNNWNERYFSKSSNPDIIIQDEYEIDLVLNGTFYDVLTSNGGEGQYFDKVILKREDGSRRMNLCNYTINYFDEKNNNIFHFEYEHYYKNFNG